MHLNDFLYQIFLSRAQIIKVVDWVFVGKSQQVLEWIVFKKAQIKKLQQEERGNLTRRDKKQLKWDEVLFLSEKIAAEPLAWFVMSEKLKKFTEKRKVQKKFSSTIRKVVNTRGLKKTLANMV